MHYAWVLILCGLLGAALGLNRTFKRREDENVVLQWLSALAGILVLAMPTLMVLQTAPKRVFSAATLLLMVVFGLCLLARPLQRIPIAFTIVTAGGVVLLWSAMKLRGTSFGGRISFEVVLLMLLVLLLALFVATFALEALVDPILAFLGLGLVVTLVSTVAVAHGAVIALGVTGPGGLQVFLR
jgi:hypothetical protein